MADTRTIQVTDHLAVELKNGNRHGAYANLLKDGVRRDVRWFSADHPDADVVAWARKRLQDIERTEAILATFGENARYSAYIYRGNPSTDPGLRAAVDSDPRVGEDVIIHAAGSWRRAIVSKARAKRIEVVWAAPSNGNLHIKSVPRAEVYRFTGRS